MVVDMGLNASILKDANFFNGLGNAYRISETNCVGKPLFGRAASEGRITL
jgi:hypothetical protein